MTEVQDAFGADWIRLYAGDLTPAELAAASDWARGCPRAALDLRRFDWRPIARRTRAIYEGLARDRPRAAWRRRLGNLAR